MQTILKYFLFICATVSTLVAQKEVTLSSNPVKVINSETTIHQGLSNTPNPNSLRQRNSANSNINPNYAIGKSMAGGINVSLMGAATYGIPFTLPPGVHGLKPSIGLAYSSQSSMGDAGWGWNISGLSAITKTTATKYHDGFIGSTTALSNDYRLMLDGQRLILKTGTYGADGSVYETENLSSIKVVAYGNSNNRHQYFIVYKANGTRLWYHKRLNVKWVVTKQEDSYGNTIHYEYVGFNIRRIRYGARREETQPNIIEFSYGYRNRYLDVYTNHISNFDDNRQYIKNITIYTKDQIYRSYDLDHYNTSLKYEVLNSVTEKNGKGEALPPTYFIYDTSPNELIRTKRTTSVYPGINSIDQDMVTGDFNGDGDMDFITFNRGTADSKEDQTIHLFDRVFSPNAGGNNLLGYPINLDRGLITIIPRTYLFASNQISDRQGFALCTRK